MCVNARRIWSQLPSGVGGGKRLHDETLKLDGCLFPGRVTLRFLLLQFLAFTNLLFWFFLNRFASAPGLFPTCFDRALL
jgi:hypothetical protein